MRYAFHGHESVLDLKDIIAFEPELAQALARQLKEPDVEDAIAVCLDFYGAAYVREQSAHLEVVGKKWAQLAKLATTSNDQERIRAIPDRLCFRLDQVWREGRAAVFLTLRAVALRVGCEMRDAPLHVDDECIAQLMELIVDGLRKGFAASVDAPMAVQVLERAVHPKKLPKDGPAFDIDWAAQVSRESVAAR